MSNSANNPTPSNPQANSGPKPFSNGAKGDEKETLLWRGSYSGKAMFGTWLGNVLVSLAVMVLPILGPISWIIGLVIISILWIGTACLYLYRRFSIQYEVTTQRLIHQRGILLRVTDRIEMIDIDDISFSQGIVQRMLGVGNIMISGSDKTDPVLIMQGIDDVAKVAGTIDDARRSERRKHSVHIEAV